MFYNKKTLFFVLLCTWLTNHPMHKGITTAFSKKTPPSAILSYDQQGKIAWFSGKDLDKAQQFEKSLMKLLKGQKTNKEKKLRNLLKMTSGKYINFHTNKHRLPHLFRTLYNNKSILACILIQNGARLDIPNKHGDYPIHIAAENNLPTVIKAIHKKGGSLEIKTIHPSTTGETALHRSSWEESYEATKKLLDINVLVDTKSANGCTALHNATCKKNYALTMLLTRHGASPNILNEEKITPFHNTLTKPSFLCAQWLVMHCKANINEIMKTGMLPLHYVASKQHSLYMSLFPLTKEQQEDKIKLLPIAQLLIEYGAKVKFRTQPIARHEDDTVNEIEDNRRKGTLEFFAHHPGLLKKILPLN